jgi:HK97 family phage major capsid protein
MEKLAELRRKLGLLTDELNTDAIIADAKAYAAKEAEIADIEGQIARLDAAQKRSAALAKPVGVHGAADHGASAERDFAAAPTVSSLARELRSHSRREGQPADFGDALSIARKGLGFQPNAQDHFRSFGDQLQAIFKHYASKGTSTDPRLVRAPTGAGEVDPTGGGFLVQVDFAASIFMLSHDMGEILPRVNKIPVSANANGLKIPGVDETSRATGSRWGGVQSNWAAEGIPGTESRPKFRLIEFDLKKLISKMTITDELLQDSTALTAIAAQAFSEEIMFMTEDAIWEGTGAGQPLGVMNSSALISVPKQNGQATQTIVKENIDNIWSRTWSRSRKTAVWLYNQDAEPQLNQMNQAVGTGGQLVYLPPGGIANAPNATLYGRPLIATEYNSALGTPGDIALVDLSQYTIIDKGGVQMATSIHVAFDTDEMRFRITYRVDGKPMWVAPLTPFKGSLTKSPFVALATR